jgi:NADPH:quinone reductase-like Zn-dependent oxidoreductase
VLKPGDSIGCDFAGDIVGLGNDAKDKGLSVGDAVAGYTRGGFLVSDNGAFQGAQIFRNECSGLISRQNM